MTEKFLVDLGSKLVENYGPQITLMVWSLALYLAAPIVSKLASAADSIIERIQKRANETWIFGHTELDDFVSGHVRESIKFVKDTLIKDLKKEPGKKLTKEDATTALNTAYTNFIERVSQADYDKMLKILANDSEAILEEVIKARIQSAVVDEKTSAQNPQTAPTI